MLKPEVRYLPGSLPVVGSSNLVMFLRAATDDTRVDRVLDVIESGGGTDDVLDILVENGIRAMPEFALMELMDAGVRVVLRGSFEAVPDTGSAIQPAVGPWTDILLPPKTLSLRLQGQATTGRLLPFRGGVVLASELHVGPLSTHTLPSPATLATTNDAATQSVSGGPSDLPLPPEPSEVAGPTDQLPVSLPVSAPPSSTEAEVLRIDDDSTDFDSLFGATTARPPEPIESKPAPASPESPSPLHAGPPSPPTMPSAASVAGGLIAVFPWASPQDAASQAAGAAVNAGEPVLSSRPTESPHPGAIEAPPRDVAADLLDDRTISRAHLLGQGPVIPSVLAARCPRGHLSPAFAAVCRVCREPIPPQQQFETPRPPLGALRLSTGAVVALDRGAILGRSPRIPSDYQGEQPNLVRVVDPEKGVSSQHLEVSLDYWNVLVRDLGSTNGTEVELPGEPPVALRVGVPLILEPGSRVVMGGQVSFVFEVTP